jgi:hypothetical protein
VSDKKALCDPLCNLVNLAATHLDTELQTRQSPHTKTLRARPTQRRNRSRASPYFRVAGPRPAWAGRRVGDAGASMLNDVRPFGLLAAPWPPRRAAHPWNPWIVCGVCGSKQRCGAAGHELQPAASGLRCPAVPHGPSRRQPDCSSAARRRRGQVAPGPQAGRKYLEARRWRDFGTRPHLCESR